MYPNVMFSTSTSFDDILQSVDKESRGGPREVRRGSQREAVVRRGDEGEVTEIS